MAYQPYPFMASSMLPAHMNPNRASADSTAGSDYIDPELRCSNTPSRGMSPWGSPHGLPFPAEHEGMLYAPMPDYNLSCKGAIPPIPTSAPLRQGPTSGYAPSDCSSALSPKGSDCERGPSPSTPLDEMSLPYFPAYYDPWDSQSQLLHLPGTADGCVKLDDVSPYQDLLASCFGEESNVKLSVRGCSTSSNGSVLEHDWQAQSTPLQHLGAASPPDETPVKDEIRIPSVTCPQGYPAYETDDEEGGGLADIVATQHLARDDDEGDATYAPHPRYPRLVSSQQRGVRSGKKRASTSQPTGSKKIKLEPSSPGHKAGRTGFACSECPDASFKDASGLQNHIKKQHTRPFTCVFGFAGCESTFAAKNEWKRHVASQHLLLNYWLCCQGTCAQISNASPSSAHAFAGLGAAAPALPNGAIFNRKDLYTQHVRRMHVPPKFKKQIKQKKTVQEWEERIQTLQGEAHKLRCDLPEYMACPAARCGVQFQGANAWDERMEHVAKHLEKAAANLEEPIVFGGPGDPTLTLWASRADVAVVVPSAAPGGWATNNPLRGDKVSRGRVQPVAEAEEDDDEDAEGEEVEE